MAANNYLALDVGERRIGVALARAESRLPSPLTTLPNDAQFEAALHRLLMDNEVGYLIVGLPRSLEGRATAQTEYVQSFMGQLQAAITVPIIWQDEALTSKKAEAELQERGKPYDKGAVDALAATYILEDYLQTHREEPRA